MSSPRPLRTALLAGFLVFAWGFCPCALARAFGAAHAPTAAKKACCECCRTPDDPVPTPHVPGECPGCAGAGCSKSITQPDAPASLERPDASAVLALPLPLETDVVGGVRELPDAVSPGPPRDLLATVVLTL